MTLLLSFQNTLEPPLSADETGVTMFNTLPCDIQVDSQLYTGNIPKYSVSILLVLLQLWMRWLIIIIPEFLFSFISLYAPEGTSGHIKITPVRPSVSPSVHPLQILSQQ